MSNILIKDIEMPIGNDELRLIIRSNGQVIISHETYYEEIEAIPIPPHGRCVDADKLMQEMRLFIKENMLLRDDARELLEMIKDASTIIPAESSKEEI